MLPRKLEPLLTGLLLSGFMSLLVSGISVFRANGLTSEFMNTWASSWLAAWLVAFPVVLIAAPLARRLARQLTTPE